MSNRFTPAGCFPSTLDCFRRALQVHVSARSCFLLVRVSAWPQPPTPTQGPLGGPQGPPRAQGALRAPWGRTALRAVPELLFGLSCEMFSMGAVRMRNAEWLGLVQTGSEYPNMVWNGPEWLRVVLNGPEWSRLVTLAQNGPICVSKARKNSTQN